jgi:hypothetical protein
MLPVVVTLSDSHFGYIWFHSDRDVGAISFELLPGSSSYDTLVASESWIQQQAKSANYLSVSDVIDMQISLERKGSQKRHGHGGSPCTRPNNLVSIKALAHSHALQHTRLALSNLCMFARLARPLIPASSPTSPIDSSITNGITIESVTSSPDMLSSLSSLDRQSTHDTYSAAVYLRMPHQTTEEEMILNALWRRPPTATSTSTTVAAASDATATGNGPVGPTTQQPSSSLPALRKSPSSNDLTIDPTDVNADYLSFVDQLSSLPCAIGQSQLKLNVPTHMKISEKRRNTLVLHDPVRIVWSQDPSDFNPFGTTPSHMTMMAFNDDKTNKGLDAKKATLERKKPPVVWIVIWPLESNLFIPSTISFVSYVSSICPFSHCVIGW